MADRHGSYAENFTQLNTSGGWSSRQARDSQEQEYCTPDRRGQSNTTYSRKANAIDLDEENDANELQRKLSALLIEKDRLEQEYWRKGSQLNSKMEMQRRKELEKAIERSDQHIQQTRNRIKELGHQW